MLDFNLEDNVLDHLKYLQDIIKKMSDNSFKIKGWCITLTSALLGLLIVNSKVSNKELSVLLIPIIGFWLIDAFYLNLERILIKRYEHDVEKIRAGKLDEVALFSYSRRKECKIKTIAFEFIENTLKSLGKGIIRFLNFMFTW